MRVSLANERTATLLLARLSPTSVRSATPLANERTGCHVSRQRANAHTVAAASLANEGTVERAPRRTLHSAAFSGERAPSPTLPGHR